MQQVGEDGKKMWSQDEPGCGASHMCTPGVSDVYAMVCAVRALKCSSSHFHSADVKNLPVPIENRRTPSFRFNNKTSEKAHSRHVILLQSEGRERTQ